MRFLPASFVLAASARAEEQTCTYALEIVQIQDASSSFDAYIDMMQETADKLLDRLGQTFDEFKYAVSSFVDKPVPLRGVGDFGNFRSTGAAPDYCYAVHSSLTSDVDVVRAALKAARDGLGSGGDFPENPYEGLLLAAYSDKIGWSPAEQTHAASGRPIARVAVLVTDDVPHYEGDAAYGANVVYPWPRTYDDPDYSMGGFGAKNFATYANVMFVDAPADKELYYEMCDLFKVVDLGGSLDTKQEARLDELIEKFGPYPYPDIQAHPGDGTAECNSTEYPSLVQVANALTKFNIMPIILVATPPNWSKDTTAKCTSVGMPPTIDCLVKVYTQDLEEMGISAVVGTITSEDAIDTIVNAIGTATNTMCIQSTTPAPLPDVTSTEETSSDEPSTTEETSTDKPSTTEETTTDEVTTTEESTTEETSTDKPTTTEETSTDEVSTTEETSSDKTSTTGESASDDGSSTEEPSSDNVSSTEESSTDSDDSSKDGSTVTRKPVTLPTEPTTSTTTTTDKKSSNIPVIAGATGGAVAAAGVAAGVLYKKFGASLFSRSGAGDLANLQQVETPTSPVDREMMEEISMEAFR